MNIFKKFIALSALAFVAFGGVAFAAINVPSDQGNVRRVLGGTQDTPNRDYMLVRNSDNDPDNIALVSGDAVVWDTNSADGVSIRTTTTSADGAFAGIVVATIPTGDGGGSASEDVGKRNWGYIIVSGGPVSAGCSAGGTNANNIGDIVITSTDAKKITTLPDLGTVNLATNTGVARATKGNGGFFIDANSGSATTRRVYLRKLE